MAAPSPPPSLYDSGADSADEVAARLADDAAGMPPRPADAVTLSCAACFARLAPRAQPHAAARGRYRTVYLVEGATRVDGTVASWERVGVAGGKRGREGVQPPPPAAAALPALHCASCGAAVGAVHDDDDDGVPVYVLWDVLPGL